MKKSWNGLLALGRSMVGLEGRPREFRVVNGGVPRFGWVTSEPDATAISKVSHSDSGALKASGIAHPTAPIVSSTLGSEPSPLAPTCPSPALRVSGRPATPVVRRSASWRWFGWFRRKQIGASHPEQIELRLEDVRPLRSNLDAEDFVVVQPARPLLISSRQDPFSVTPATKTNPKTVQATQSAGASTAISALPAPVAKGPADAPSIPTNDSLSEPGRLGRWTRWIRNREATAFK